MQSVTVGSSISNSAAPVGVIAFAIPPGFTIDFSSRNLPAELTICNSICDPELIFHEGRAVVSSMFPEIGVSRRIYYTSGDNDENLLSITIRKLSFLEKGIRVIDYGHQIFCK